MLVPILAICAIALTIAGVGLLAAKKRQIEQQIADVVARKLKAGRDALCAEATVLREENGVLRNLLMDIAENEATARVIAKAPEEVKTRLTANRAARRRELMAEVDVVLRAPRCIDASM